MDAEQLRALAKVRCCLDLAADVRGNVTERETAWRQAQSLIAKHGLQLERFEAAAPAEQPGPPPVSSPLWAGYWATRTPADAMAAGVRTPVLTAQGWFIPGG